MLIYVCTCSQQSNSIKTQSHHRASQTITRINRATSNIYSKLSSLCIHARPTSSSPHYRYHRIASTSTAFVLVFITVIAFLFFHVCNHLRFFLLSFFFLVLLFSSSLQDNFANMSWQVSSLFCARRRFLSMPLTRHREQLHIGGGLAVDPSRRHIDSEDSSSLDAIELKITTISNSTDISHTRYRTNTL